MGALPAFCKWLEMSAVGASVRQSLWLFPAIEALHLLGMAALLATVGTFDLRLMGLILREQSVTEVSRRVLPWAAAALGMQTMTGGLLFASEATHMAVNPAFRFKMLLIVLAGVHAMSFHVISRRDIGAWNRARPPMAARIAGCTSMILWIGVVAAGRWIGFI